MEVTNNSLIHNGKVKLHSVTLDGRHYEYTTGRDSVATLLVEPQDDPMEDVITIGTQFRLGAYLSASPQEETLTSAAGHIEGEESPEEASHRESMEEFGAKGAVHKLGSHLVSPGKSTAITHLFFMEVKEWGEPTDLAEGITAQKMKLRELLQYINSPYTLTSLHLAALVNKYARLRGV